MNTIVKLAKIKSVVTQFHTVVADYGHVTPLQQNLVLQVSPPISAN